jgi:hypothetical protein
LCGEASDFLEFLLLFFQEKVGREIFENRNSIYAKKNIQGTL